MATLGRVIKYHTGEWGGVLQVGFLFATATFLLLLALSPRVRSRTRVFLNKHFFAYRYDYRHEWLQVIATMSTTDGTDLRARVIRVLAQLLDSRGGLLWTRERGGGYSCTASWRMDPFELDDPSSLDSLTDFLVESGWVIDLDEFRTDASSYPNLSIPSALLRHSSGWLIVPLLLDQELQGMVLLARSRTPRQLNWEDHDLLKTMGRQVSSYLALVDASKELLEARQFEAFNRLTAFLIHDLKNMVAQLTLVVSNAKRYGSRPEFLEDAVATLDNVTVSMSNLVASLRRGEPPSGQDNQPMLIGEAIGQTLSQRHDRRPVPELVAEQGDFRALADPRKLTSALDHLLQNAQEATPETGRITVTLRGTDSEVLIDMTDTGAGMDAEFVRERLFKPFDSTKGNGGMGIGAYQARQLVREMGGELSVRSKPGVGTTFTIRLPRMAPARAAAGDDVILRNAN
jgi:putative PEP-CTERM system histidine kinase